MRERGGALLMVLWLSAALSAIAFSLATTVRGEIERTTTDVEGTRARYLAEGAVYRAIHYVLWGLEYRLQDGSTPYYYPGKPVMTFEFPTGQALAQVVPETAKLNLNTTPPEELFRLFAALGVSAPLAEDLAGAVADWRTPVENNGFTPYDRFYLSLTPSFRPRHASFQEIEELLMVKGMTPEIFYGTYGRDSQGKWIPLGGARDCLSVWASGAPIDINTAHPAVLLAAGVSPGLLPQILEMRARRPFQSGEEVQALGGGLGRLGVGGGTLLTIRATARLRNPDGTLSDLRRSISALVKLIPPDKDVDRFHILRWYDNEWVH